MQRSGKSVGMRIPRNFEIDIQNDICDMFVGFTENNNLKIMNTFFDRMASKE